MRRASEVLAVLCVLALTVGAPVTAVADEILVDTSLLPADSARTEHVSPGLALMCRSVEFGTRTGANG